MNTIYLDHNATTPVHPDVLEAMLPYLRNEFGNPSSLHQPGQRARKAVEEARQKVASFIGAEDPGEIIFTSGGTESINTALKGALEAKRAQGNRIVSTAIEHSAVRQVIEKLAQDGHAESVVLPIPQNGVTLAADVEAVVSSGAVLVSIIAVNNEIGTIQPVSEISRICRKSESLIHVDAVQAAGKIPINVQDWDVDLLSLSGHKMGAPKGIGVLYVRRGTRLSSLVVGGNQEKNRRGGTEAVANIVGLGAAVETASRRLEEESNRLKALRDQFETRVLSEIPLTSINGDPNARVGNTSNICFPCTDSSEMVMALDLKGVQCSNGSACASGSVKPSHVLLALGHSQDKAHASLRFSLGWTTTEDDMVRAVAVLIDTVSRVRERHPLYKETLAS